MTDSNNILENEDIRKSLVDYYKWIVTLAALVLTISLSLAGLLGKSLDYKPLMVVGWGLLFICIFFNWLIIKRLIIYPIVAQTKKEDQNFMHTLYQIQNANLKTHGIIQNIGFLLGSGILFIGFALNWLA